MVAPSALAGQRFGRLQPLAVSGRDPQGRLIWRCTCDCGCEKDIRARHLTSGSVVSCGCVARSRGRENGKASAAKISGPRSHLYKPHLTADDRLSRRNLVEVRVWRSAVYHRDNFTCDLCGTRGGKVNAHHLNSWAEHPEQRFDVANGVTLCRDHHKAFHDHMGGERKPCALADYAAFKAVWYVQREIDKRERGA